MWFITISLSDVQVPHQALEYCNLVLGSDILHPAYAGVPRPDLLAGPERQIGELLLLVLRTLGTAGQLGHGQQQAVQGAGGVGVPGSAGVQWALGHPVGRHKLGRAHLLQEGSDSCWSRSGNGKTERAQSIGYSVCDALFPLTYFLCWYTLQNYLYRFVKRYS